MSFDCFVNSPGVIAAIANAARTAPARVPAASRDSVGNPTITTMNSALGLSVSATYAATSNPDRGHTAGNIYIEMRDANGTRAAALLPNGAVRSGSIINGQFQRKR